MVPSFEEILQSDQFTFRIGDEKKPIVVHAAAVAATSEYMDRLINGGMSESETNSAEFFDVRYEDFIRFCEYAYRGDYTTPRFIIEEVESNPLGLSNGLAKLDISDDQPVHEYIIPEEIPPTPGPEPEPEPLIEDDPWGSIKKKKKGKKNYEIPNPPKSNKSILRNGLDTRKYLMENDPRAEILNRSIPDVNTEANQDFTPVFLAHARLYCFANMRLIAPLRALALHKLHQTLISFKLYSNRVGDVVELARYAYCSDNTPDRNDDGTIDELRKLIVEYIACEIDIVGVSEEFVYFMEGGGQFVSDFWSVARQYLI